MTGPWIFAFGLLCAVVVVLAFLLLGTFRRVLVVLEQAESHLHDRAADRRLAGLKRGMRLPEFTTNDAAGTPVRSSDLAGQSAIFLLMDTRCEPCADLAAQLKETGNTFDDVHLFVVCEALDGDKFEMSSWADLLLAANSQTARSFNTSTRPYAFAIDADGFVADSSVPNSVEDLKQLAHSIRKGGDPQSAPTDGHGQPVRSLR